MTRREELAAQVAELRAQGLIYREIAERLGIGRSFVGELAIDPEGLKVRARKLKQGGTCVVCGVPTTYRTGGAYEHCNAHAPRTGAQMQAAKAMPRRVELEEMWHAGASLKEIAEALGTTVNSLGGTFARLRKDPQWDLPYRYRGYDRKVAS